MTKWMAPARWPEHGLKELACADWCGTDRTGKAAGEEELAGGPGARVIRLTVAGANAPADVLTARIRESIGGVDETGGSGTSGRRP